MSLRSKLSKNKKIAAIVILLAGFALVVSPILASVSGIFNFARPEDERINILRQQADYLEEELVSRPDDGSLLASLGFVYYEIAFANMEAGRESSGIDSFKQAIAYYDRAIEKDPENTDIRLRKALAAYHISKEELAEKEFIAALEIDPEKPDVLYYYGLYLYLADRYDEAHVPLSKLVNLGVPEAEHYVPDALLLISHIGKQGAEISE